MLPENVNRSDFLIYSIKNQSPHVEILNPGDISAYIPLWLTGEHTGHPQLRSKFKILPHPMVIFNGCDRISDPDLNFYPKDLILIFLLETYCLILHTKQQESHEFMVNLVYFTFMALVGKI